MKVYEILKTYPGLDSHFKVGDIIYNYPIEGDSSSSGFNVTVIPSIVYVYKKILHQQKDPFIWAEHVENNPDYFMKLEMIEMEVEGNTVIIRAFENLK